MAVTPIDPDGALIAGGLANAPSQADFRQQVAILTDLMRQVAGDARVSKGATGPMDALVAPFTLYVNPFTGSDKYVAGNYNSYESSGTQEEIIEQKLKRVEEQMLVCGYTPQRPFKTINRACLEAAIITSKEYYTISTPDAHLDCVVIALSAGYHTVYNGPGSATGTVTAWTTDKNPTPAELQAFNPPEGGLIIPRYASLAGIDLRKVSIRPDYVPGAADEVADYSNRSAIFRVTASGYYFGFTFFDKLGLKASHHLLDCFQFAGQAQLDLFYQKIKSGLGGASKLLDALLRTRPSEYQIAAPLTTQPTEAWDTTVSASPYVFNCSIRSNYGLCGIFADGTDVGGFRSFVTAQFTGVSLQKDLDCWEVYKGGSWVKPADYDEYISFDPDDIRMKPSRLSRHISSVSDAFIQEVSVFAIGQGIHHYTDEGGEITITNSNSSFGGCAAISTGYRSAPFPLDKDWNVGKIKTPTDLTDKSGNIKQVTLGTVDAAMGNTDTVLRLIVDLQLSSDDPTTPEILAREGYTLKADSYVWVENPVGPDFRAKLAATPFDPANPDQIVVKAAFANEDGNIPGEEISSGPPNPVTIKIPDIKGKRVYIRRMIDVRSPDQRTVSMLLGNTGSTRRPVRDFVIQTTPGVNPSTVKRFNKDELLLVSQVIKTESAATTTGFDAAITVRLGNDAPAWQTGVYYRQGEHIRKDNKHYSCLIDHTAPAIFNKDQWTESYVHMPEAYEPEAPIKNEAPIIIFDGDSDPLEGTASCGYNMATVWNSDADVRQQYRSGTDYRGMHGFLTAIGFPSDDAHTLLLPRAEDDREFPVDVQQKGLNAPAGAATDWGNWAIEFRRPSIIRLYGHAWEWAGYLNYSKSLPRVQLEMGPQNKFTYYFTNVDGGRVYGTGFNEDGYQVTPRGVEDIATGETRSVDQLGSTDTELDVSVSFTSLDLVSLKADQIEVGTLTGPNGGPLTLPEGTLPRATQTGEGIVEIATIKETRDSFLGEPLVDDGPATGAEKVVGVSSISGLRSAILTDVKILENRYRYLYVDPDIQYVDRNGKAHGGAWNKDVSADPATIKDIVWDDIKAYRSVHELGNWTGSVPSVTSDAYALGQGLAFKSLKDVFTFLDNRSPLNKGDVAVWVYGESDIGGNIDYKAPNQRVFLRCGRSAGRPYAGPAGGGTYGAILHMNGQRILFDNGVDLRTSHIYFNGSGTKADPDKVNASSNRIFEGITDTDFWAHNCYFRRRERSAFWVFFISATNIRLHHYNFGVAGDVGNTGDSVIVFDLYSSVATNPTGNYAGRGHARLTASDNLDIRCDRPRADTRQNGARKILYKIDQRGHYQRPTMFHAINDGAFTLQFQDSRDLNYIGGDFEFDCNLNANSWAYASNIGVSSSQSKMDIRFIQNQTGPIYPEDAINITLTTFINWDQLDAGTQKGINALQGFDIGRGLLQDYIVDWGSDANSFFQIFRIAFYNYLLPRGAGLDLGVSIQNDPNFAWIATDEGGTVNKDLLLAETWWDWNGLEHEPFKISALTFRAPDDYSNAAVILSADGQRPAGVNPPDLPESDDEPPAAGT